MVSSDIPVHPARSRAALVRHAAGRDRPALSLQIPDSPAALLESWRGISTKARSRGQKATVMLNGLPVTRMVHSVMEVKSSNPMRWIVSVVPKQGIAA
jgi:hypothetical protein